MTEKKPIEIARESLMRLNARKLAPTPANYQAVYNEIAGVSDVAPFPQGPLRKIARALPARSAAHARQKQGLDQAIQQCDWQRVEDTLVAYANAAPDVPERPGARPAPATGSELLEAVARLIENALPALGEDDEKFRALADSVVKTLRDVRADPAQIKPLLASFSYRLSFAAEDQAEVRAALMRLLQLIIQNLSEWSLDDRVLSRQMEALQSAATPPLSLRRLDDLERRMKDVMFKQIEAKGRTLKAQEEMQRMLARFIERLTLVTDAASSYRDTLEAGARRIEAATSIEDIAPVLQELMGATRAAIHEAGGARDELTEIRDKVNATESEIAQLRQELVTVIEHARHDPLTGALNRCGLAEALLREMSALRRNRDPLCVALLDIDNFKKLNDSLGHGAGDAALTHLAQVARESLRPRDSLARYGGEEFVILMPDTDAAEATEAMRRLQRALTRRYFLSGADQILITFSAGVAQLQEAESGEDAITRADQAMYLAKRAGKNRVVAV